MKRIITIFLMLALFVSSVPYPVYTVFADDSEVSTDDEEKKEEDEDALPPEEEEPYYKYGIRVWGTFQNNMGNYPNQDQIKLGEVDEEAIRDYIKENLPELKVERILANNYAFVANDKHYWNLTEKGMLDKPVLMDTDGKFYIPGDIAQKCFNVGADSDYISADEIITLTDWEAFSDIRGIVIFGKNIAKNIDTNINSNEYYNDFYPIMNTIGFITWDDVHPTREDYDNYMKKFVEAVTYPIGKEDEYRQFIDDSISAANEAMATVDKNNPVSSPFTDVYIPDLYESGYHPITGARMVSHSNQENIENACRKIKAMALGYYVGKRNNADEAWLRELKEDIDYTLEFIWKKHFTNNVYTITGTPRFTTFRISIPAMFTVAFALMGEDADRDLMERVLHELMGRQIVPTTSNYTNLLWEATAALQMAVMLEEEGLINHCMRNIAQCFSYVYGNQPYPQDNNGFHEDGSFPYHGGLAYNLGYGQSFLISLAELAAWTEGTFVDVSKIYNFNNVYDWIEDAWLPFIYNNQKMKMVVGREAPYTSGRHPVAAMIMLALRAPKDRLPRLASKINAAIQGYDDQFFTPRYFPVFRYASYPYIQEKIRSILSYIQQTDAEVFEPYNKIYYNMERVVHWEKDYMFGIAMSSERIGKYESSNTTPVSSLTEWYISDGMTYIHNDDVQFLSDWWTDVNPYFMPGTTVDSTLRTNKQTMSMSKSEWGRPENAWAGGVSTGKIGSASMVFGNKYVSGLAGRSSWFMFDDKIVCVGSGIRGGSGNVYTVIDNRKLVKRQNEAGENLPIGYEEVVIDGKRLEQDINVKHDLAAPSWIWVEKNTGYVFTNSNNIRVERAENEYDYYEEYRDNPGPAHFSGGKGKPYLQITAQHGATPDGASYDYTILPLATKEETETYAKNPEINIIEQSENIHAIKTKDGKILMANAFAPAAFDGYEVIDPCAVIIEDSGSRKRVYISDPSHSADTISIKFPGKVAATGEHITVNDDTVTVDVHADRGATFVFDCAIEGLSADAAIAQSPITTHNYNLTTTGYPVTTTLTASSQEKGSIKFEINRAPKNGSAYIEGNKLIYTPVVTTPYKEQFIVTATDEKGNKAEFMVDVERRSK